MLRRDVNEFFGEVGGAVEFFEEVGVAGGREVDVGVGGIFGLLWGNTLVGGRVIGNGKGRLPSWRMRLDIWEYTENSG